MKTKKMLQGLAGIGLGPKGWKTPEQEFHSVHYLRHNARRLEHLASLRIPVAGNTVLEVGAGIGDHSTYYLDRNCAVTITEAREENLVLLRKRFPEQRIAALDMENPTWPTAEAFDVVHCYGLLYHLSNPEPALDFLARHARRFLFLETCVSFGSDASVNPIAEEIANPSQAFSGQGCRPTRVWIFNKLKELFPHVYLPTTQPNHEEFPLDWTDPASHPGRLQRAVFIASREALTNDMLVPHLPDKQSRHA